MRTHRRATPKNTTNVSAIAAFVTCAVYLAHGDGALGRTLRGQRPFQSQCATLSKDLLRPGCELANHQTVHDAFATVVIVDRVMPNQAVVPKGNGVIFPTEAATELGPHSMLVNVIQQRCTF